MPNQKIAIATTLLLASGCSVFRVTGAPYLPLTPETRVECTVERAAPNTDLGWGIGLSLLSIPLLNAKASSCDSSQDSCIDVVSGPANAAGAVALGAGLVMLASSGYGYVTTAECAKVLGWLDDCSGGDGSACARLGAPMVTPGGGPPMTAR